MPILQRKNCSSESDHADAGRNASGNEATSLTRTVRSNTRGEFTAASLPTGTYTVTAEAQGFKTATVSHIQLGVDQRIRVDLKLEIDT